MTTKTWIRTVTYRYLGIKMIRFTAFVVFINLLIPVNGQECTHTVGSLGHDNNLVVLNHTFILADYTVPCSGTVVAWEFCYRVSAASSVRFYPGIWRISGTSGNSTDYALVQSNTLRYDTRGDGTSIFPCQTFNLSATDQFTAPAGSVVGLYSFFGPQLLRTNTDSSITTYRFSGNQSSVNSAGNNADVNYNISMRVHLAVSTQECTDTVIIGSLSHNNSFITADQTFILTDYVVPCSGTVIAWEFCYQISGASSATFYPGIWRITGDGITGYSLAQSNSVTYDQSIRDPQNPTNPFPCQIFNLSDTDQFTAPARSVVGLYSDTTGAQLLRTNTDSSVTTYQFNGNQSSISNAGNNTYVNYSIAIRVYIVTNDTVTTTTITTTTAATTATTTTSIVSTSDIVVTVISAIPTSSAIPANDNGGSSNGCGIIGGVMGVFLLLLMMVIVFLCIIIVYMRRSHKKTMNNMFHNASGLNKNVMIESNPSYDVPKADTGNSLYSTIKREVPINANPSYGVSSTPYNKASKDEYNYVQPNEFNQHSGVEGTIKKDAYPVTTGDRTTAHHSSHSATTKEYDYAYTHDDHLLHHSIATNISGDAKEENHATVGQNDHTYIPLIS